MKKKMMMKIAMMILPLICILVGFVLYMKKFKIDEKMYADILNDLEQREGSRDGGSDDATAEGSSVSDAEGAGIDV